jgi:hypothetical protein
MDTTIRLVGLFIGAFIGTVLSEYIVMRRHESDESLVPSFVPSTGGDNTNEDADPSVSPRGE